MLNEAEVIAQVIAELLASIQTACRDYFLWTHGRVLYDHGVEALLHVYAGQQLFARFGSQYQATVRLEHTLREILPNTPGRADLTLTFPGGPTVVVEFKRYFNDASIRGDLARLRKVAAVAGHHGILAGPCFIRERDERDEDWVDGLAAHLQTAEPGRHPHLSESRLLPSEFLQAGHWSRSRAIALHMAS